jgi:hypothetical protein
MAKEHEMYVDFDLASYSWELQKKSPDLRTDLAVLMWVLACKRFNGVNTGWAQFPIGAMSRHMRVGHAKLEASLDRLVGMGIMERKAAARQGAASWYRIRKQVDRAKESVVPEKRRRALKKTPKAGDQGMPEVELLAYTGRTMEYRPIPLDLAAEYPTCPVCGTHYESAWGMPSKQGDICPMCLIYVDSLKLREQGGSEDEWFVMTSKTGEEMRYRPAESFITFYETRFQRVF